jgi:GT2 family glycosyltransferase
VTTPLVSITIVNYNAGMQLGRCLEYIEQQTYRNWEALVIDNASQDGSLDEVEWLAPEHVIRNSANVGFAAAQNQALRRASGTYLMPLNYDIRMEPGYVEALVLALEADPSLGSACGKLLCMDEYWRPSDIIDTTGLIMGHDCAPRSRGHGEQDIGHYDASTAVFGAQGAAPLYRRDMLEDVAWNGQYFDERYFMWYEDTDLDWRAYLRGWKCQYVPAAVAYHAGHSGARRERLYVVTTLRNRWWMMLTNLGLRDLARGWKGILRQEWSQLRYVVGAGLLRHYVSAALQAVSKPAYVIGKRRAVRSRAIKALWTDDPWQA